jgi:hypothetical protein
MAEIPETIEVNVVMGAQLRAIVRSALIHVRNKLGEVPMMPSALFTARAVIDEELEKWPLSADPADTLAQWLLYRFASVQTGERFTPNWNELSESERTHWEHEAAAVRRAVGRGGFKTSPGEVEISTPVSDLHQAHANSNGEVKGYMQLDLKRAEDLGEAIRIAVGAASMCWSKISEAGIFQSETALDIATQLEHHVTSLITLALGQIGERHQALGELLAKYNNDGQPVISVRQALDILTGRSTPVEYGSALQVLPRGMGEH